MATSETIMSVGQEVNGAHTSAPPRFVYPVVSTVEPPLTETLEDPYYHRVPLPRILAYHKLDKQARLADLNDRHASTTYAYAASNTWHA